MNTGGSKLDFLSLLVFWAFIDSFIYELMHIAGHGSNPQF